MSCPAFGVRSVTNDLAYVTSPVDDFEIFDVKNPLNITRIGSFKARAFRVQVVNGIAYLGAYSAGVLVLDVRDPRNIVQLASFDTVTGCLGIGFAGGRVFAATSPWGLSILELNGGAPQVSRFMQPLISDGLFQATITGVSAPGTWIFERSSNLVDWIRFRTSTEPEPLLQYPVSCNPKPLFFRTSRR